MVLRGSMYRKLLEECAMGRYQLVGVAQKAIKGEGLGKEGSVLQDAVKLDRFQEKALRYLLEGYDVLVCAPTGAGKTKIAEEFARCLLREDRGLIYTAPLKAISNQKYRDFSALFGLDWVGLVTGDLSINRGAPLLVMTTEIFRNRCFNDPDSFAGISCVVFDEIHYLGDGERGTVWEESIIFAPPHLTVLGLSATVRNALELGEWMQEVRGKEVKVITETVRPVPLTFRWILPGGRIVGEKRARRIIKSASGRSRSRIRGGRSR